MSEESLDTQLDVGHLLLTRTEELNLPAYRAPTKSKKAKVAAGFDDKLNAEARDSAQLLINALFSLPFEANPEGQGKLVQLPDPEAQCPRAKPVPKPRPQTKWERFAALKGIPKKKRSRNIWDENLMKWVPRYGAGRKMAEKAGGVMRGGSGNPEESWVVELKAGEDMSQEDPFSQRAREKKERVAKNKAQQLANLKLASKTHKESQKQYKKHKERAVPVDLASVVAPTSRARASKKDKRAGKLKDRHSARALDIATISTASMGNYDRRLTHEGDRAVPGRQKRLASSQKEEHSRALSVLRRVMGSAAVNADDSTLHSADIVAGGTRNARSKVKTTSAATHAMRGVKRGRSGGGAVQGKGKPKRQSNSKRRRR